MKTTIEATKVDGVIVPKHEIEIVCSVCQDPISEEEEGAATGSEPS